MLNRNIGNFILLVIHVVMVVVIVITIIIKVLNIYLAHHKINNQQQF
jgi:hypothetical protein